MVLSLIVGVEAAKDFFVIYSRQRLFVPQVFTSSFVGSVNRQVIRPYSTADTKYNIAHSRLDFSQQLLKSAFKALRPVVVRQQNLLRKDTADESFEE